MKRTTADGGRAWRRGDSVSVTWGADVLAYAGTALFVFSQFDGCCCPSMVTQTRSANAIPRLRRPAPRAILLSHLLRAAAITL